MRQKKNSYYIMNKNEILLSSLPFEELKMQISEAVLKQLSPIINSITQKQPETELLTRKEVSELLDISYPTLNKWTKTGQLIGYRIGSKVRYKQSEIVKALSQIKTK